MSSIALWNNVMQLKVQHNTGISKLTWFIQNTECSITVFQPWILEIMTNTRLENGQCGSCLLRLRKCFAFQTTWVHPLFFVGDCIIHGFVLLFLFDICHVHSCLCSWDCCVCWFPLIVCPFSFHGFLVLIVMM